MKDKKRLYLENMNFSLENERLKKELMACNARIVELATELEYTKGEAIASHKQNGSLHEELNECRAKLVKQDGLPFVEDVKEALSECSSSTPYFAGEEEKAFTSRFMPNVKFIVPDEFEDRLFPLLKSVNTYLFGYMAIDKNGTLSGIIHNKQIWDELKNLQEVSIYEALPELVPEGMVYDKESDSLVKKL